MGAFSEQDLLLAATLCPGVMPERWVPALVAALRAGGIELGDVRPPRATAGTTAAWRGFLAGPAEAAVAAERDALSRLGAWLLTPLDAGWPAGLPPWGVLRGQGSLPGGPHVAIVGSRRADRYGRDVAQRAARAAACAGVPVVSGGALGTDVFAHEACLDCGGSTVVVLGSGLAHASPVAHRRLFARAARQGAVLSPFPCDLKPAPSTFPRRNPFIAGLAAVTVVLQAGETSGALHTARAAASLGRPVYALPGPIDSPLHVGCHALMAAGASLLAHPGAWLSATAFSAEGVDKNSASRTIGGREPVAAEREPPFGQALWRVSGAEAAPLSVLAEAAGLSVSVAAALALQLELSGWLTPAPGGRFARSFPGRPPRN